MRQNVANSSSNFQSFEQEFLTFLDKHAPYKSKKIQANQAPYVTNRFQKVCDYRNSKREFAVTCIKRKKEVLKHLNVKQNKIQ